MWVGFQYTIVVRVLSGFRMTSTSRKVSWASESADEGSQRLPKHLKFVILLAGVYEPQS